MSGNIKYIGETNNSTPTQLPTSGFGFSISNSDGKDNALKKFASSFTDNKTKESMIHNFTSENSLVDTITQNANNPKVLNNVLDVKQTPLNDKDCSVYTISRKTENRFSPNPSSSEGLLNSEETLMPTNEVEQKLKEMLDKKQVEIAELQSQLQSQLQLKQEGYEDLVLKLEKEIALLKLFEDEMNLYSLYRLRNEIGTKVNMVGTKVNMDLQETINSMKTLLETTKQTREQVSQSEVQPTTTVEIKEKADTALSQSDLIMEKSNTALFEAQNIIAEFEKQSKNEEANMEQPIVVPRQLPSVAPQRNIKAAKAVSSKNKTKTISEEQKQTFVNFFETELLQMDKNQIDKYTKKFVLNSIQQDSLDDKFKNALELYRKIHNSMPPEFTGGKSHRHGKRLNSRKPRAFKNKTKTRRYRKRSFTRRRK